VPAASAAVPDGVPALATDQGCTRRAERGMVLRAVPYRTDDLRAMTLPKSRLGSAFSGYGIDWWHWGYMDDAELRHIDYAPRDECRMNRAHGRITGFSRGYTGTHAVATATHLFFTADGAAAWLRAYVAGMKELPGTADVTSVRVTRLPDVAGGAFQVTVRCASNCRVTWVWFRNGPILGSVLDAAQGAAPVLALKQAARRLDHRISARRATADARGQDPFDAVMALSAGLPKARLGQRYQGLVWDWFYGGCWDPVEARSQGWGPLARGMLTFCRAMYVPPEGTAAVRGVERVFNGGILYRKPSLARDALASVIDEYRSRAGRTVDGTSYGPLVRWDPGSYGDRTVGLKQRVDATMTVRAFVLRGRYLEEAALNAASFAGMTRNVRWWTRLLDARVSGLLTTRTT
jgi:hypothetical protein